jgi:hypothetical protein
MSYYLIAVGGTGAKIAEAAVHLTAAGVIPGPLVVLFVDGDEGNGSVNRAIDTVKKYCKCQGLFDSRVDPFRTTVTLLQDKPWSPIDSDAKTLGRIFGFPTLARREQDVMRCLFSDGEIDLDLTEGFRARPAIGSAVWAHEVNWTGAEGFGALRGQIGQEPQSAPVKVVLAGSIFGGTGASGVPTIAKLLSQQFANCQIAMFPLLPYFTYGDVGLDGKITADPTLFISNTKEALKYYGKRGYLDFCHSIYLIGDEYPALMLKPAVGRRDQCNEPHYLELVAALGIAHFFKAQANQNSLYLTARKEGLLMQWEDLPAEKPTEKDARPDWDIKFRRLSRFAVVMHNSFAPTMNDVLSKGKSFRAPWYLDLLEKRNQFDASEAGKLKAVAEYGAAFLEWLMYILRPKTENFETRLLNREVFSRSAPDATLHLAEYSEFAAAGLEKLFIERDTEQASLDTIWERVCDTSVPEPPPSGVGRAIQAIYSNC